MTRHITAQDLNRLCARTLPAAELVAATAHMAECEACHEQFRAIIARRRGNTPISFRLAPEVWLQHEHLDYELLQTYTENTLPAEEREIVDLHLALCARCREDVRSLQAFQRVIAPELKIAYAPAGASVESENRLSLIDRFSQWLRPPIYAAAAVCVILLASGAFWWLRRNPDATTQQAGLKPTPSIVANAGNSNNSAPPRVGATASPTIPAPPTPGTQPSNQAKIAQTTTGRTTKQAPPGTDRPNAKQPNASVQTGQGSVAGTNDSLPDVAALPVAARQEIATVLQTQRLEKPEVLAELAGGPATLRGNNNNEEKQSFRLLSPVSRVTLEARPVFRWKALPIATGYRVFVLDGQGQEVAASPDLPANKTNWQPATPLPAGATYSWAVVAIVAGKEVVTPAASQPEMKFHLLATEQAQALTALKRQTNSHLALGIVYARAGLRSEAKRELQLFLKQKPQSAVARKLLRQVQSWQ